MSCKCALNCRNTCKLRSFEQSIICYMCIDLLLINFLGNSVQTPQLTDLPQIFVFQQILRGQNCHSDICVMSLKTVRWI